jgi:hypothetical protein
LSANQPQATVINKTIAIWVRSRVMGDVNLRLNWGRWCGLSSRSVQGDDLSLSLSRIWHTKRTRNGALLSGGEKRLHW